MRESRGPPGGLAGDTPRRRWSDHEPRRGWAPSIIIASIVAVMDWVVKLWVVSTVALHDHIELVSNRVALWHVRNDAMVLGLYGNLPLTWRQAIAAAAGIVGALLIHQVIRRGHRLEASERPWVWTFVGLASGGMLGNLGERAIHWGVTDYLSFKVGGIWLPPGNIADLALFASIPLAVIVIGFELRARMQRGHASTEYAPAALAASTER